MTPRGVSRRRLAKAGIGAAGVLWTAQSHATMKTMVCVSPSAALSGGIDSNDTTTASCRGKSPGYWKNHGGWPCDRKQVFGSIFGCGGRNANTYGRATLEQIIRGTEFDKYNLGKHLIATYLNIETGRIGFLSVRTLMKMWGELQATGHYQPAKGVYWTAEQTKRYLEATHD